MKTLFLAALVLGLVGISEMKAEASGRHVWVVPSPVHGQTYSFGSEQHQAWIVRGSDKHLALATEFTNDPYVDRIEPREYDYFTFDFPDIALGSDGRTFYYHTPGGKAVAVAVRSPGFLGLGDVKLLDNSYLLMKKPHGYLTLALVVQDHPFPRPDDTDL